MEEAKLLQEVLAGEDEGVSSAEMEQQEFFCKIGYGELPTLVLP